MARAAPVDSAVDERGERHQHGDDLFRVRRRVLREAELLDGSIHLFELQPGVVSLL